jgi:hypothetical protein
MEQIDTTRRRLLNVLGALPLAVLLPPAGTAWAQVSPPVKRTDLVKAELSSMEHPVASLWVGELAPGA